MQRILKIDDYEKSFPTMFGLDADGSCYDIKSEISIEVLADYSQPDDKSDLKFREPSWESMVAKPGDTIVVSQSGCYIIPKDSEGFMECRPVSKSGSQEPSFDKFETNQLNKLGKGIFKVHPLSFDQRRKIITSTLL